MKDLNLLHSFVKYLVEMLIKKAKAAGVDIVITSTYRTLEEQAALYAQGRTKPGQIVTNCKPGQSPHNYKVAFDFAILNKDGKTINWSDICDTDHDGKKDWYEVGEIGKALGLTWGGDFKSIIDKPHFEWTGGLTLKDLKAGKVPFNPLEKVVLKFGDRGTCVKELQMVLFKKGYSSGGADGIFGTKTLAAVKVFQSENKLTVDGIVGPMTWAKLLV